MFSATDRAETPLWGRGGVLPSWVSLGVTREEKVGGKDVYGITRLTSNTLPLPSPFPIFLTMAPRWRWDCRLDGHLGKNTQHSKTIDTAKKIQQKIHVIKPPILAWAVKCQISISNAANSASDFKSRINLRKYVLGD